MKSTSRIGVGLLSLAGLLAATAAAQSLGEIARQQRQQKPPATAQVTVYTNDNLPTSGALSEVGHPAPSSSPASDKASAAAEKAEQKKAEDRSKLEAEWRAKFAEQKNSISLLQRELDVAAGESKHLVAYDYINHRANPQFTADNAKHEAEINAKQKALADAKQKLEDMQEELRKAGLPNSWAD